MFLCVTSCLIASEHSLAFAGGPGPQFEIDLKELDKFKGTPKQTPAKHRKESPRKPAGKSGENSHQASSAATYTVKSGDNLFKILMRDFGLSNREAELRIPELVRINNLSSSTNLTVGSKLVIPAERQAREHHHRHHSEKKQAPQQAPPATEAAPAETVQPLIVPAPPGPVVAPQPLLSVKSIAEASPYQALDQLLTALGVQWAKDRVIDGSISPQNPESFSIKVDYYLELAGKRYVLVACRKDPYEYTMLRLLEMAGYSVVRLDDQSGLPALANQLLSQLGFAFSSGQHRFTLPNGSGEPKLLDGFLVTLKTPNTKVFITGTPLDAVTIEKLEASTVEPTKADPAPATPEK
nr:LysM domain-containing protein [Geoanaerobacter pelophilus]